MFKCLLMQSVVEGDASTAFCSTHLTFTKEVILPELPRKGDFVNGLEVYACLFSNNIPLVRISLTDRTPPQCLNKHKQFEPPSQWWAKEIEDKQ